MLCNRARCLDDCLSSSFLFRLKSFLCWTVGSALFALMLLLLLLMSSALCIRNLSRLCRFFLSVWKPCMGLFLLFSLGFAVVLRILERLEGSRRTLSQSSNDGNSDNARSSVCSIFWLIRSLVWMVWFRYYMRSKRCSLVRNYCI